MMERQKIIHKYIAGGKSLRQISREMGISRPTVTKVIKEYEQALSSENAEEAVDAVLTGYYTADVIRHDDNKSYGFSVRCLRD